MPTLLVDTNLYNRIEEVTIDQKTNVDQILIQALRNYLWELDRRKISVETKIYHPQHAKLKVKYFGQYIATHQGKVVDNDADFQTLYQRIQQKFGRTAIMITLVEEKLKNPLVRRGIKISSYYQLPTNYYIQRSKIP